jgi:ABC-2 type transport system permease protein
MKSVMPIIWKEFREIWRDPYTLGIAIVLPLVLLFLFGYALNLDVENIPLGVVDLDNSAASRAYAQAFTNTESFEWRYHSYNPEAAARWLDRGKVQVVVVIPADFSRKLEGDRPAEVQTLVDGTFPTSARVIQGYMEAVNEVYTMERHIIAGHNRTASRAPAVIAMPQIRYNPTLKSTNFIAPGLIGVVLMAFPPLLTALAIVREKEHGSIQQIFVSPLRPWAFIVGKLIPYAIIAFGELLLVLLAVRFWFGVPLAGSVWLYLLAGIPYVFSTVAIGLAISTFTHTQLSAMLMATVLTLMPSFIFSGFLWSVEAMPPPLQFFSSLLPASHFVTITRGVFNRGVGLGAWWKQLASLVIFTALMVGLATLRFKKRID